MASVRPVYGLPSNPRDNMRPRRHGSSTDKAEVPAVARDLRKQRETTRLAAQQAPAQTNYTCTPPEKGPARRPSIPVPTASASAPRGTAQTGLDSTSDQFSHGATHSSRPHGSGTSSEGIPIPARSMLRKKQQMTSQSRAGQTLHSRADSEKTTSSSTSHTISSSELPGPRYGPHIDRVTTESPAEINVAQTLELPRTQAHAITIYPELDRYRNVPVRQDGPADNTALEVPFRIATHDLPPPTPAFSGTSSQLSAGSPSTRFFESPGPGTYSRDTTPTSISSQSPSMLATTRFTPHQKPRQLTPVSSRPPVTRRRTGSISKDGDGHDPQGLAAVRESLTSSSSNSTVRDAEGKEGVKAKKKTTLASKPPSPPPRKSSHNFRDEHTLLGSPPRQARGAIRNSPVSALPSKPTVERPSPLTRATPPLRPSRDDMPDLQTQLLGPPPVVLSNLTQLPASGERPASAGRQGSTSNLPRRTTPSPSPKNDRASPLPIGREPTPNPRSVTSPVKSPEKVAKSPNTSTFNTRFPFFKRSKTTPDLSVADEKPLRKGPVAGTGHEGYGRIGSVRRRSGSLAGRSKLESEGSQGGTGGVQSADTFLQDRMSPVVISGGEIIHSRNVSSDLSQTESNQSFTMSRPSMDSRGGSEYSTTSSFGRDAKRASSKPRGIRAAVRNRRPSESSDSEAGAMRSTLAYRRSVQRLRSSPDQEPLKLPKPIITDRGSSPAINSRDTSLGTDDSFLETQVETVSRGRKATTATPPPKKLTKRAKSPRKWNPFSRSQSRPRKTPEPEPVSATVKVVQQPQVPFYAMMDGSEQEDVPPQNIEDVLRDAHVFGSPSDIPTPPPLSARDRLPSEPLRSPVKFEPPAEPSPAIPSPSQELKQPRQLRRVNRLINPTPAEASRAPSRPSRLPQVGRIPKVVNTRLESTSPRSFSRPFNRLSYQRRTPDNDVNYEFVAKGPSPPRSPTPDLVHEASTAGSGESGASNNQDTPPDLGKGDPEFLAMSPNKRYQGHTSSSSSGSNNYAFAYELSVIPDPNGPLVEDEIWDEYNDLLGDVPPSATSSKGTPFHLETALIKSSHKPSQSVESPTLAQAPSRSILTVAEEECVTESESSSLSGDMTERLKKAFAQKPEPKRSIASTPTARSKASPKSPRTPKFSATPKRGNTPKPSATPKPSGTPKPGVASKLNSVPKIKSPVVPQRGLSNASNNSCKSESASSCRSSEDESPLAQVNLRVGSMTVSKWLSFGHVLFSPARDELIPDQGSLKRQSILVIDGLGNDDWSFYAAETYPAATFFNMSPRAPLPASRQTTTNFPLSPPNHHQIQYVSHMDKFPFSQESFTSVVFRFPAAAPESHYRNIVSEARRVLKPGGYMELSILDVDLNNMGNHGRRAIRRLKERIHEVTPDTSLGSSSDLVVRLLGKQGFTDIKTCHVGVPVASVVTKPLTATSKTSTKGLKRSKDQRSLADMMNDKSDSADENITKMVAKVGRWWYTRCYESAAGCSSASKSIWADHALLAECEELRTSLKLMVCYARLPERSRIASI